MPTDPEQWTQSDAVKLRTYIASHPKFLRALMKKRPKIEGDTMESRAVTGSDVNGFFSAIESIEALQRDPNSGIDNAGFINTGDSEDDSSNQS